MIKKLKVIADENIPSLDALLGELADIHYLPGRSMQAEALQGADALLVRSITCVDEALLAGTSIQFVGSCTIGTDHVDLAYLAAQKIAFANAPGCNAAAVVDYVLSALFAIEPELAVWQQRQVGIVGCGQVGSRLQQRLAAIGIATQVFDPFVPAATASFDDVLRCDAISLHVPLTRDGEHPTLQMFNAAVFDQLADNTLLINSSRGKVVDNRALLQHLQQGRLQAVLDVYEDEPTPSIALLQALDVATAHIAGYSLQGKIRGSMQVVEALYRHFAIAETMPDLLAGQLKQTRVAEEASLAEILRLAYDIRADSAAFLQAYSQAADAAEQAQAFDRYRKQYPVRYEWSFQQLVGRGMPDDVLKQLGFVPAD